MPRSTATHFGAIMGVARKELTSSLRDKQTAIYTLVLPICLYPVLFWMMLQGYLLMQGQRERTETDVGLAVARPEAMPDGVRQALTRGDEERPPGAPRYHGVSLDVLDGPMDVDGARAWLAGGDRDPRAEASEAERPDAVLHLPTPAPDAEFTATHEPLATLFSDSTESRSQLARERLARRLPVFADQRRNEAARAVGVDPRELDPIERRSHNIAPRRDTGALVLSMILPLLLVVMAVMGAFFPAVDLTAGEKERGTTETTLLLPVPRGAVHQGKILAVCATAVVATFLNLFAIGLSAEHLMGMLSETAEMPIEMPVLALFGIAPLAVLFAFFVSATLAGIAGLARSFKEGQALLGPVQMVFILPAMVGMIPGVELTPGWALVPVVNVVLAFRAMLLGKALLLEYALTSGALLLYALLAIGFAVRLLSRESVLLAGGTIPFRKLFSTLRSSGETR